MDQACQTIRCIFQMWARRLVHRRESGDGIVHSGLNRSNDHAWACGSRGAQLDERERGEAGRSHRLNFAAAAAVEVGH